MSAKAAVAGVSKSAKAPKSAKAAKSGRSGGTLLLVLVVILSAAFLPVAMVVFSGMLPTAVAFFIDRDPRRHAALTVGGLNFCGVLPFVIALLHKGYGMAVALAIMAHPITWLVMLGGAALGWMIYLSVPPAVAAIVVRRTQAKAAALEQRKKKIAELWDPPLSGAASPASAAPPKRAK